jgi:hypothetical protein
MKGVKNCVPARFISEEQTAPQTQSSVYLVWVCNFLLAWFIFLMAASSAK